MFKKGMEVVYPMQGIGKIVDITIKTIERKKEKFYVVMIDKKKLSIIIPVKQAQHIGLRKLISKEEIPQVMKILRMKREIVRMSWSKRFKENLLKLKTGSIFRTAEVLKELAIRQEEKFLSNLSNIERNMYKKAREFIVEELAKVKKTSPEKIEIIIDRALKR